MDAVGPGDEVEIEVDRIAALFGEWADGVMRQLPLYHHLCSSIARDRAVVARLLLARPDQRIPNLLLAAVHDVVLAGQGDPLDHWYASVNPEPRRIGRGGDDPWPHFRRLAMEHEGVEERLRTRVTQTNEVGRCATLLPALAELAADGSRLGLVEVGASAGLNLLLDHYGYCYTRTQPAPETVPGEGDALSVDEADDAALWVARGAPLALTCALRGNRRPPVPAEVPHIASRVGLDQHPVDIGDREQARWLVACQWPDQPERVHRARTAIALAHGDRPRIVQGDAVDDLAPLVEAVPPHVLPVVITTWVLNYLTRDRREAFVATLDRLAAGRDLSFVFSELPTLVDGLPVPPRPDGGADGRATALVRVDWRGGERTARRLADQHPHGAWLEWLAD